MENNCPIDLSKVRCKPCEGGTPPLEGDTLKKYLLSASDWQAEEDKKIKKEFKFKDFVGSIDFVNKVAGLAEAEGHHPSIFISYNKVRITLTTHAIGGLSENDFIMAAKINKL
ncbi:MAG TPA: 4a-hydroxytetrahydrobiopterin dehydratase [Candidatus Omnitrophica bacterium]|nr:4a-hydroxytetrahydrobiopterin dehydratase [Candidatus Omnitrophota bacterium]